jgi:hypothetical protein
MHIVLNHPINIDTPPPGTLTPSSSGTAAVVPVDLLRALATGTIERSEFLAVLDAIAQEQEDEDMVSAWPEDTGLTNAIKIIPGNPQHGPRIKVALNPPDRFSGRCDWAWVPFGEAPGSFNEPISCRPGGPLPSEALLRDLRELIELNRADLVAFDRDPNEGGISGAQLVKRLRKVGRAR